MNKYFATVRILGQSVKTMVFAESAVHARLILEFQFGIGNALILSKPSSISNFTFRSLEEVISTIKPLSPQQARIDSLKKQKELLTKNLSAERDRQKITKAQQQIRFATSQKNSA
jgi:hypothetical protein